MAVVGATTAEVDLLARLMRAEAVGEGELGMLMVGNVGVNRVIAICSDFKNINSITNMVYQEPGGFSGTKSSLFYRSATSKERALARRNIKGETYHPATNALWFYAPGRGNPCKMDFYGNYVGRYKEHCFYRPDPGECVALF